MQMWLHFAIFYATGIICDQIAKTRNFLHFECAYFKDVYLQNVIHYQRWLTQEALERYFPKMAVLSRYASQKRREM